MTKSFKDKLYSLLSDKLDTEETFTYPSELAELINSYMIKITGETKWSENIKDYKMKLSNLSSTYKLYEPINYSKSDVISYMLYYFPINFPKIQYILYDLIRYGSPDVFKKNQIIILDVGAGCGTVPISLSFFLKTIKSICSVDELTVDIIEQNKFFRDAFTDLKDILNSEGYGVPIVCENNNIISDSFASETTLNRITDKKYDFITFSNVISESQLSTKELAEWIVKYENKLNDTGHLIIIEPEDPIRARKIAELKNFLLEMNMDVYCPGEHLWGIVNKNCDHWCVIKKSMKIPEHDSGFSMISTYSKGINFTYLITSKKGYVLTPNTDFTKLSDLKIGRRVNIFGKVIERNEYPLVTHLFLCDGTQKVKLFAYKYEYGGSQPKACHKKIENIKINDVVIFNKVWVKSDKEGLQVEIDNVTENPTIFPFFE